MGQKGKPLTQRWATCPVCGKERKYSLEANKFGDIPIMTEHRRYEEPTMTFDPVTGLTTFQEGYMTPCEGSGTVPQKSTIR